MKVILIAAALLLLALSILGLVMHQVTTPINPVPTTIDTKTYESKFAVWATDLKIVNQMVLRVLNGQSVSDQDLHTAGVLLFTVQQDIHATVPPQRYLMMHTQLQLAVDTYVDALRDLANGDRYSAADKFDKAAHLFATLKNVLNSPAL